MFSMRSRAPVIGTIMSVDVEYLFEIECGVSAPS